MARGIRKRFVAIKKKGLQADVNWLMEAKKMMFFVKG